MHCYEVIPEGAVCKLYFDLEFHKPSNKGADGKTMVSSLIQVGYIFVSSFTIYLATFCSNIILSSSLLHIQNNSALAEFISYKSAECGGLQLKIIFVVD